MAGFALGAGTALIGRTAAMACTAAVEEVIEAHYTGQADWLEAEEIEGELKRTIEEFRADETGHKEAALEAGAGEAPAHEMLSGAIKAGTRLAIWLSERF
jgi:ubiquinone biosynthesis monooxygenase Coq7